MEGKAVLIGRHKMLPAQNGALRELEIDIAEKIEQVNDVREVVEIAKKNEAKYIVVQALPLPMLMQLWQLASREGIEILLFKQETVGLYGTKEEAMEVVKGKEDRTVILPSPEGSYRVVEFTGIERVERIAIETETIWPKLT